LQRTEYI